MRFRAFNEFRRSAFGAVHTEDFDKGRLVHFRVLAGGLAKGLCVGGGVKDVVDDLKPEPEIFCIGFQRRHFIVRPRRRQCPRPQRRNG